jgi:hypothetical protein
MGCTLRDSGVMASMGSKATEWRPLPVTVAITSGAAQVVADWNR